MKITKNQLKEIIRQSIDEIREGGKGSGRKKGGGDYTGGPSYANIPKGAKTSKQAKKMLKKKKEEVKESLGRKTTVKEIKQWFKTLEENRYKKTYNSDARRVSWLVNNNLSEDYDSMPVSMRKKWSKAQYGRERYLANEYIKHTQQKELSESKLTYLIRDIIKEVKNGKKS